MRGDRLVAYLALGIVFPLFAGCIGGDDGLETASTDAPAPGEVVDGLAAHRGGALVALPAGWEGLVIRLAPTGFPGGEPTLGVTSDGTIFASTSGDRTNVQNNIDKLQHGGEFVVRSQDNGATWEAVGDPVYDPKTSLDPWVWVDPTTDRVYHGPLYVVCTWLAWSDDKGETWDANPTAGCGTPAHDHQKVTTGPPAEGVTTDGYPNVVYYAYNSFRGEGHWVEVSYDGGATWQNGQAVHPEDCQGGIAGGIGVGPDGTAYSAKPTCDGVTIAVSRDSGATWEKAAEVNDAGHQAAFSNPDIAIDTAGNVYVVYPGEDDLVYLTTSQDLGQSWSQPLAVTPPHVKATTFSVAAAGEPGRLAIGYLCTDSDPEDWPSMDQSEAPAETVWHLCMTFTEDGLSATPTFVTQQVTPDDDPVQIGCIWLRGGSNPCRNMLDFIEMVQRDGRAYLVYSDGCDKCATADDSRGRVVTVAVVDAGPNLVGGALGAFDAPAATGARR